MRRIFALIIGTALSVVSLRLLEVNTTGRPAAAANDRDELTTSQVL